ncbi:hybrid sensor histidine kinase/response regulator [Microvirga puerhi]|uniref:histidine kinase n=1 Tax=Microvirga puerhi TaxID=2876078 RepID=A0ABS7VQ34_9HYPH|nr:PAS domain-containing sensor histidine kinase [Microvirga puerhi]MBZ6077251.1 PAS domain S-box protein [Microvirga puerhi]
MKLQVNASQGETEGQVPRAFPVGGGETGALIRSLDWSRTSLGPITSWPQSLKTALDLILQSPVPMVMLWGKDGVMLYNDAYSVFAGGRHPRLLGSKVLEGWSEVADFNRRVMEVGLNGGTLSFQDQHLILYRNGVPEDVWMDLNYSPILDESYRPGGVLAVVVETTQRVRAQQSLEQRDEQLRLAQEAGGIGMFDLDIATDLMTATPEFCRIYGLPVTDEFPSSTVERLVLIEDKDIVSCRKTRAAGQVQPSIEYRIARPDTGELRWIGRKARFVHDPDGRRIRFVGAVQDITDRKVAEEALRESEARFRLMANSAPVLIWATDAEARPSFVNKRHQKELGLTLEKIHRGEWRKIIYEQDSAAFRERFQEAFQAQVPFQAEFRAWDRHGQLRWLRCEGVPRRDSMGQFLGYVGCNVDITEARLAADALEAQVEQRTRELDSIWRVSKDLFCICGFDGLYQSVNPAWTEALGYAAPELIGRSCLDLVHAEDVERSRREFERLKHTGMVETDLRIQARDGSYRWYNWTSVAEGDIFYAAGRDITARKELEEQLRQSQKMEAIGQLTGGIAHDFNNLLTGIIGSLDLLQARIAQGRYETLPRYADAAITSASKAAALTHRLLAFARRQPLDPRPVHIDQLVRSMEDLLHRTIGETIALNLKTVSALWLTRCDPNQLENALLNLVINARDAMPKGGTLTIETSNIELNDAVFAAQRGIVPGQYVALCVTDTGIGMSPEIRTRAFDPFFTTKPLGQGTGLGLSMIYGFAKQSEGHVRIDSELGRGTTVKIYLPRYEGSTEDEPSAAGDEDRAQPGSGEVVLVVEDDATVRSLIVDVLAELGYRALEACDGPSGLKCLQSDHHIDLLITDVGLPGINGRQLADAARGQRPALKILFMTGYAENVTLASGFLDHGMEMITKPFAVDNLAKRIRDMIEHKMPH